jgi:hypothetical protein
MNTNLQNILLSTLEKAQKVGGDIYDVTKGGIEKAIDFAKEQIPDIIAQLLKWEFAYHLIWAMVYLGLCGFLVWVAKKCFVKGKLEGGTSRDDGVFCYGVGFVVLICAWCFLIPSIRNASTCIKIGVAPKIFLIEYCSDLVQASKNPDYLRTHDH